eukprot:1194537-Prorocentrum_minimum.AAC.2
MRRQSEVLVVRIYGCVANQKRSLLEYTDASPIRSARCWNILTRRQSEALVVGIYDASPIRSARCWNILTRRQSEVLVVGIY